MSVYPLGSMYPMGVYDDCDITHIPVTKVDPKAEETRAGRYVADCERHGISTCFSKGCPQGNRCEDPKWESGCYNPVWRYYAD